MMARTFTLVATLALILHVVRGALPPLPSRPLMRRPLMRLRGGAAGSATGASAMADQCYASWEWMAALGAPAALVGGAAIASFFELREGLAPRGDDSPFRRSCKATCLLMLLSSFACEIVCVFVGQVTGDAVQSNGDAPAPGHPAGPRGEEWGVHWGSGSESIAASSIIQIMMDHASSSSSSFSHVLSRLKPSSCSGPRRLHCIEPHGNDAPGNVSAQGGATAFLD